MDILDDLSMYEDIGNAIKFRRKVYKESLHDFSKRFNISGTYLCKIENMGMSATFTDGALSLFSVVLNIDIDRLKDIRDHNHYLLQKILKGNILDIKPTIEKLELTDENKEKKRKYNTKATHSKAANKLKTLEWPFIHVKSKCDKEHHCTFSFYRHKVKGGHYNIKKCRTHDQLYIITTNRNNMPKYDAVKLK